MLVSGSVSHRPWRATESTLRVPGVAWACLAKKGISTSQEHSGRPAVSEKTKTEQPQEAEQSEIRLSTALPYVGSLPL